MPRSIHFGDVKRDEGYIKISVIFSPPLSENEANIVRRHLGLSSVAVAEIAEVDASPVGPGTELSLCAMAEGRYDLQLNGTRYTEKAYDFATIRLVEGMGAAVAALAALDAGVSTDRLHEAQAQRS